MNATQKTFDQLVDAVTAEIAKISGQALAGNITGGMWIAVRLNTDGEAYSTIEASPCYSESEYYKRVPHTLTAWSDRAQPWNGADDDCPVDAEGGWYNGSGLDDAAEKAIERDIEQWIEAGNYQCAE